MAFVGIAGLPKSMRKTLLFFCLAVFLIPLTGSLEGVSPVKVGIPAKADHFIFLPPLSADLDNLDVRDAQNRPIKSPRQLTQLKSLFNENLFKLEALDDLHSLVLAKAELAAFSPLLVGAFLISVNLTFRVVFDVINFSSRRVVHNVGNLWITISVGVLLVSRLLCFFRRPGPHFPLYLRC